MKDMLQTMLMLSSNETGESLLIHIFIQETSWMGSNSNKWYHNSLCMVSEIPGLVLSATIVDRFGRKLSMAAMFFLCCIFLLQLMFPQHEVIRTLLLSGARLCITGTFTVVYIYTPEVGGES